MGAPPQSFANTTADVGLQFINRYARASVNNQFKTRPLPSGFEADDLVIEIHIALCETLGPTYAEQVGNAVLRQFQGTSDAEVKKELVRCVRRGIGRPQWNIGKRLQRDRSRGRHLPREEPIGDKEIASPRDVTDRVLDLTSILESFDEQRRVIWERLVAGQTLREIGIELGLSHQQVQRRSLEVMKRIARYFGEAG